MRWLFVLFVSTTYALDLQLLGGVWILQTFPAIVIGLYSGWFHRWALIAGWAVGMVYGTLVAYDNPKVGDPGSHFGSPLNEFPGHRDARLHRLHRDPAQPAGDGRADRASSGR